MSKRFIFGAGETAGLILRNLGDHINNFRGFVVDNATSSNHMGYPMIDYRNFLDHRLGDSEIFIGIGYSKINRLREEIFHRLKSDGVKFFNIIGSNIVGKDFQVGESVCIFDCQTIQSGVVIGSNVLIWSGNHIGHDSVIGAGTYISSHVAISGHVTVGERCFIGVNASIRDGVTVGDDCVVGMGATVSTNMSRGSVAVSTGTSIFPLESREARYIRKKF